MPAISIIVPIYKVEKYLPRCLDSILAQTFADFECILVDDGSPDNCGKICDEYAEKDSRIKVIHKANGGQSSARNAGLDIAKGDYIGFIDSDDWIEPNMYELLLNDLLHSGCDIAMCDFFIHRRKKSISSIPGNKKIMDADEIVKLSFSYQMLYSPIKLYNKRIFAEIRYPEDIKRNEDFFVFFSIIDKSQKMSFVRLPLYHYIFRESSITNSNFSESKYISFVKMYEAVFKLPIVQPHLNLLKAHYANSAWNLLSLMNGYYGGENSVYANKLVDIIRLNKNYIQNTSKINFILMKLLACGFPYKIILSVKNNLRKIKRSFV